MKFPHEEALRKLMADTLRLGFASYLSTSEFNHLLVEHGLGSEWTKLKFDAELQALSGGLEDLRIETIKYLVARADDDTTWRQFYLAALVSFAGQKRPQLDHILESMKKLRWSETDRKRVASAVAKAPERSAASPAPSQSKRIEASPMKPKTKSGSARSKSRLFIGSSREGLSIANAVHTNLQREFECTVWTHGVFGLSKSNIEALEQQARTSDFAVIVVSPDDTTISRGKSSSTPRDNVVFELGLFMGALGRERTFAVQPQSSKLKVPSDLFGITFAEYEDGRSDGNWEAALGPACIKIRDAARLAKEKE